MEWNDNNLFLLHEKVHDAQRRGKIMIFLAWFVSLTWSLPQAVVYEVEGHPYIKDFYQCVTFNFFTNAPQQRVCIVVASVYSISSQKVVCKTASTK